MSSYEGPLPVSCPRRTYRDVITNPTNVVRVDAPEVIRGPLGSCFLLFIPTILNDYNSDFQSELAS